MKDIFTLVSNNINFLDKDEEPRIIMNLYILMDEIFKEMPIHIGKTNAGKGVYLGYKFEEERFLDRQSNVINDNDYETSYYISSRESYLQKQIRITSFIYLRNKFFRLFDLSFKKYKDWYSDYNVCDYVEDNLGRYDLEDEIFSISDNSKDFVEIRIDNVTYRASNFREFIGAIVALTVREIVILTVTLDNKTNIGINI